MKRREFITLLGGAAAGWPLAARAQQGRMPAIGFLNGVSFDGAFAAKGVAAVRQGLSETGFVEGQNVAIEYRSADGQYDRLPDLAADLVRKQVAVIVAVGSSKSPQAARAATSTIPIVFAVGSDPVDAGLITNIRRPEANLTGVALNNNALVPKRLEVLLGLIPGETSIGYLRNPTNAFDTDLTNLMAAARTMLGRQLAVFTANTDQEVSAAFQSMAQQRIAALIVSTDATFIARRYQITALATQHAIPAIYPLRTYVEVGGLVSYGVETDSLYRQAGIYAGRILKGEKSSDLPVLLPTKFELVFNLKTAKALGLNIPPTLLAISNEVIEIGTRIRWPNDAGRVAPMPGNAARPRRRGDRMMRRREFITLLGGAVAWPLSAGAQQTALPVIGFLNPASPDARGELIAAFHQGLAEAGYVDRRNVAIEYRWAEGRNDRLPVMAADLVQRRVTVIVAADGTAAALAAKAATPTIPIVFMVGADPVELGLVESLVRPGGNMTGVGALAVGTVAKRLQLLHELVPAAAEIAFLRNPTNPYFGALETRELQAAAAVLGVRMLLLNASNPHEIEVAFANLVTQRAGGFLLGTDPFFITARDQLVALANRHAVPAIYPFREDAAAGGLVSYGASNRDAFRLVGGYTGSILSGNKPADLPVQQVTKIEMTVNLRTAKALGLSIPLPLLGRADEVIE